MSATKPVKALRVAPPLPPWRASQNVLARIVRRVLDCAASAGFDRQTLVEASGLSGVDLSDGDARVPISSLVALWQLIGRMSDDPGLAIHWAASVHVRDWGLLGYLLLYADTLGDALGRIERYCRIVSASADARLNAPDRQTVALLFHNAAAGLDLPYAVDYLLSSVVATLRLITGVQVVPLEVDCVSATPSSTLAHREFYRCPVRFSQPESRIVLDARDTRLKISKADADLAGYLSKYADEVLASLVVAGTLREQVHSVIWQQLGDGRLSMKRIAAALDLPPRTLQRRLAAEGTSVQRELDEIRRRIALAALRVREHSIDEIAFFLGYAEPSTFFRQFKRWTGMTPREFRQTVA